MQEAQCIERQHPRRGQSGEGVSVRPGARARGVTTLFRSQKYDINVFPLVWYPAVQQIRGNSEDRVWRRYEAVGEVGR